MKKQVYIAYTGGTIGMKEIDQHYQPCPQFLQETMASIAAFQHPTLPDYIIHEYEPLLDSTNMTPTDWSRIAQDIYQNYEAYDGFIVLHGTDTMAYTASALAFMFRGLEKPIIVTGSQIPLCEVRSDAQDNLITALLLAAQGLQIPEVTLYFNGRLLRGCRSVKVDAADFHAFDSPNYPPLARIGIEIEVNRHLVRTPTPYRQQSFQLDEIGTVKVGALRLFPGISAEIVENMLQPPLQGLILETYGAGNAPTLNKSLLEVLRQANQRGVVIVNCTQCLRGSVQQHKYETGSLLAATGVISGFDMTAEAALTKLAYLLTRYPNPEEVRYQMQMNLRGELTSG